MVESKQNQSFVHSVRVYVEDTDAGGIVYYVNYLKFMERARTELLRQLGYGKAGANREGFQFVVHSAEIQYKKPARLDDNLAIVTKVTKLGAASVVFEQEVRRDEQLLCVAQVKIGCVDGQSLKPIAIPTEMTEDLKLTLQHK